jgi:hypothetical protein
MIVACAHGAADCDDRAVHGRGGVGEAVRHEVLLQVGEASTRRGLKRRNLRRDRRRVELLAMVKKVSIAAVPIAPPRLRIMLNRPEAPPASL